MFKVRQGGHQKREVTQIYLLSGKFKLGYLGTGKELQYVTKTKKIVKVQFICAHYFSLSCHRTFKKKLERPSNRKQSNAEEPAIGSLL